MTNPHSLFQRNAGLDTSTVGDRVILFERATKRAIVLNPSGARLWQLLETPHTTAQLGQALQTQFPDTDAAQIAADVENYLRELRDQKLVIAA